MTHQIFTQLNLLVYLGNDALGKWRSSLQFSWYKLDSQTGPLADTRARSFLNQEVFTRIYVISKLMLCQEAPSYHRGLLRIKYQS